MLAEILNSRRQQLVKEKKAQPLQELEEKISVLPPARSLYQALTSNPLNLIAEVKKASPSAGEINLKINALKLARVYETAGAGAISVLTENRYFKGNLSYLSQLREFIKIPLLRKDFIIDYYQLYQSRVYGADAVLLIVAALGERLAEYLQLVRELGMEALVEIHDEEELMLAQESGAKIIGINNRNLHTMVTDISVTERLAPKVSSEVVLISESGIKQRSDVERVKAAGARAILVGETLVRAVDPGAKIHELISGGELRN